MSLGAALFNLSGMRLIRHPDFLCDALAEVAVEIARPKPQRLVVRYGLRGVTDALVLPEGRGERLDELWKRTCFEAFVQAAGSEGYLELNATAAGDWAAYRFENYRHGMAHAPVDGPDVSFSGWGATRELSVGWDLDLPPDADWRVGVSAVIEEAGGRRSYWALAHPAGRPDFHDTGCFVGQLMAPQGA